jgi:hypothetical protein
MLFTADITMGGVIAVVSLSTSGCFLTFQKSVALLLLLLLFALLFACFCVLRGFVLR